MEETELLDALDRRARRAVTAVDRGLGDAEPAPLPVEPDRRQRPWVPLLVAAALVVVALAGIGLALDGRDDEQGTVADDGEGDAMVQTDEGRITRLALADPGSLGYTVRAAFDGSGIPAAPGADAMDDLRYVAHGPAGAPDPWGAAIVSMTYPADDNTFFGELVDVGGPEAVHLATGPVDQVWWRDGDQVRNLMSSRVMGQDLVDIATAAVAASWDGDGPLPSHRVLLGGAPDAFHLGLEYAAMSPTGWQGVAYDRSGFEQDFVIGWRPGGSDSLRALHALDRPPRSTSIADRDVLIRDGGSRSASHASWLEDDDTVVQVATHGDIDGLLAAVLGALEPISQDDLGALVSGHPAGSESALIDQPESVFAMGEGEAIASVSLRNPPDTEYRLEVRADGPGELGLMLEIDDGAGVGGSGAPLRDARTPYLFGGGQDGLALVVSGVLPAGVPADLAGARFVDRATGRELTVIDRATSPISGSDAQLVIVLLDADPTAVRVDVTFQTAEGERTWRL